MAKKSKADKRRDSLVDMETEVVLPPALPGRSKKRQLSPSPESESEIFPDINSSPAREAGHEPRLDFGSASTLEADLLEFARALLDDPNISSRQLKKSHPRVSPIIDKINRSFQRIADTAAELRDTVTFQAVAMKTAVRAAALPQRESAAEPSSPLRQSASLRPVSYAAATASTCNRAFPSPPRRPASHVVVVKPKTGTSKTNVEIIQAVRKSVNPAAMKVGITGQRQLSSGGICIETTTAEASEQIRNAINSASPELDANIPAKLDPRLIIFDIDDRQIETAGDLVQCIIEQNDPIAAAVRGTGCIIPVQTINHRKPELVHLKHWVVQVSPAVYQAFMKLDRQRVCLDWSTHAFEERITIRQCRKCSKFHHLTDDCKSPATCSYCSSGDHALDACPLKSDSSKARCSNCSRFNTGHTLQKHPVAHPATSRQCPVYLHQLSRAQERRNYVC